ncbi:MAG TPA: NADH-quinone oxidoreductase subunit L [Candidatus Krumholzibacteriaceae bacterium]|nr:NADH-quinone oxidoreductase subunit L [Candidatus Krumholzibacteriaceae bacterium]
MSPLEIFLENPWPWLSWILPVVGAVLMPVLGKIDHKLRDYGAVFFAGLAAVAAASMIPSLLSGHTPGDIKLLTWFTFPNGAPLEIGVLVDPLSIIISNVVAFISFLIVVYSVGYMHGDPHLERFWFLFLFFIGNMLLLVLSNNLLQTLIGWEGVGLCSYGLIGYYYRDAKERWLGGPPPTKMFPPSHCGMKAFVVTGIGDVFILASIFIIYYFAGTLNYYELINTAPEWLAKMGAVKGLIPLTAIFFLGGPIGKSAQFPLHEWLPEAMAGPTSVSALIHAATMVKAGVYLVARMSPVFYIGAYVLHLPGARVYFTTIAVVGAFTCFLAASQALVSVELKKILAYSTVSQIGYMMLGLGLSGFSEEAYIAGLTAGVFHLASHALFKGALFLCAGSVIHSVESIYTFNMGGLKKHMPKTYLLMLLATLSLSGIPPFSGFWSKDAVFLSALVAGTPLAMLLLAVAVISAAMTFAYSLRYISRTFLHEESEFIHELEHNGHHIHEAPSIMWAPISILVVLFCVIGLLGLVGLVSPGLSPEIFIEEQMHHALEQILPQEVAEHLHVPHISGSTKLMGAALSAVALAVGGYLGYNFYWTKKWDSWAWVQASGLRKTIYNFLWNRWYMNPAYYLVFVDGLILLSKGIFSVFEAGVMTPLSDYVAKTSESLSAKMYEVLEVGGVFGVLNQGVPTAVIGAYHRVKKVQTGVLSMNLIYMFIMLVILLVGLLIKGG